MYSMQNRGSMILTRPLSNLMQPMHSLTRFQWVDNGPYKDPNWYPGESVSTSQQRVNPQNPTWAIIPRPANAPVMPLTKRPGGKVYPTIVPTWRK